MPTKFLVAFACVLAAFSCLQAAQTVGRVSQHHARRLLDSVQQPETAAGRFLSHGRYLRALSAYDTGPGYEDDVAGLQVAVRQQLLDYGVQVGLDVLRHKVSTLRIPDVAVTVHVPVLGAVDITISNIECIGVDFPDRGASLLIEDSWFHLTGSRLGAAFSFHFEWSTGVLSSGGDGTLDLVDGVLEAIFSVLTEGRSSPILEMRSSAVVFDNVHLHVDAGLLGWLYNALASVFHSDIVQSINAAMGDALRQDVPKTINAYLSDVPSEVIIVGLPFWMAFQYAIYTRQFVMVKAFPEVLDREGGPDARRCPAAASPLALEHGDILRDGHMLSVYLSQSVVQCAGWALHRSGALVFDIKDGDLPALRLITDLFAVLLPGVQKDYPHMPMRIRVESLRQPDVDIIKDRGVRIGIEYQSTVFVETPPQGGVGSPSSGEVEVARLNATLSMLADFQWDTLALSEVDVRYAVVDAAYNVSAAMWEGTVRFVLREAQSRLGVRQVLEAFISPNVSGKLALERAATTFYDGWYQLSADVRAEDLYTAAGALGRDIVREDASPGDAAASGDAVGAAR